MVIIATAINHGIAAVFDAVFTATIPVTTSSTCGSPTP
jgi:hypothetical protein